MNNADLIKILNLKGLAGLVETIEGEDETLEYITSILRAHLAHREVVNQKQVSLSERINKCPESLLDALEEHSVDIVVKGKNDGNDFLIKDYYAAHQSKITTFAKGNIYEKLRAINPTFIEHQLTFKRQTKVKEFKLQDKTIASEHLLGLTVLILDNELNYTVYTFDSIVEPHEPSASGLTLTSPLDLTTERSESS